MFAGRVGTVRSKRTFILKQRTDATLLVSRVMVWVAWQLDSNNAKHATFSLLYNKEPDLAEPQSQHTKRGGARLCI